MQSNRKFMANPQEEIKKTLSIKSWRMGANHYWSVGIGVTGHLRFYQSIKRTNERNSKCKKGATISNKITKFSKSVYISTFSWLKTTFLFVCLGFMAYQSL